MCRALGSVLVLVFECSGACLRLKDSVREADAGFVPEPRGPSPEPRAPIQ